MTDGPEAAGTDATASQPVAAPVTGYSDAGAQPDAASPADEHPEFLVGAAFAGGLLLATILRRLAR